MRFTFCESRFVNYATDWFAFAKEILAQAKDGNPEEQLALFDMYRHCFDSSGINRKKYNHLSDADALNLVRDETFRWSGSEKVVDAAVARFRQCHGFDTDEAAGLGD